MKRSKRYKEQEKLTDRSKVYSLDEAVEIIRKLPKAKFDETVELSFKMGVDVKKSDQMIRGSARLPYGTGKTKKVLVFCEPEKEEEAKKAGADYAGGRELIDKINSGWMDFDYCISTPSMMRNVSRLGRILGPRGLMPSPKTGSVTENIAFAVEDAKKGKIDFKMDKFGCVNAGIGKVSFPKEQIVENAKSFIKSLIAAKPAAAKGKYIKSAAVSATMSIGLRLAVTEDI